MRVVISPTRDFVVLHGMLRNERVSREEIVAVEVGAVGGVLGDAHTVSVLTRDGETGSVGSMAAYGFGRDPLKGRVGRQGAAARQALDLPDRSSG